MNRALLISLLLLTVIASCSKRKVIPKNVMSDIYYDMYMTDKYLDYDRVLKKMTDSLLVYEPIFNKYGYTFEEYQNSVNYYLGNPGKFVKVFKKAENKLKERKYQIEKAIAAEEGRSVRWNMLDSLDLFSNPDIKGNGYFRSLNTIFFIPDTIPITAPVIDSAIIKNIENRFFLYDSIPSLCGSFTITSPVKIEKTDTLPPIKPHKPIISQDKFDDMDIKKLKDYGQEKKNKREPRTPFDREID